jgi:hypothetical protein
MSATVDRPGVIVPSTPASGASPDLADAVAQAVRLCFGVLSIAQAVALRPSVSSSAGSPERRASLSAADAADLVVGSAWAAARLSGRLATLGSRVLVPLAGPLVRPPLVPRRLHPAEGARRVVESWRQDRPDTVGSLGNWSGEAVAEAVEVALNQLDMQRLVRVVLDNVDLDELLSSAIAEVDLAPAVSAALDQLDLTQIVLDRVDLIGLADYVVDGIDLPGIIRESTGSVASEAVHALRLRSVEGDAALARAVDRLLHGRRRVQDQGERT